MKPAVRDLYAAMLQRDLDEVRELSAAWLAKGEDRDLFDAVSRFTALAFNPSQHGKHAFLAAVAAGELREVLGERWGGLLIECAVYAASGRLPWSEAPMFEPPPAEPGRDATREAIRNAVAVSDLAAAERWLAAKLGESSLAADYFRTAREAPGEAGGPLITAVACWKLSGAQNHHPSWPVLRAALVEWCGSPRGASTPPIDDRDPAERAMAVAAKLEAERGSIEVLHELLFLDADLESSRLLSGEPAVALQVEMKDSVYPLARDFAAYLLAHPAAGRLAARFPEIDPEAILDSCRYNLEHSSWEDWSFG
ncbi:MAG: hypothetical protein ABR524_01020 [Thermoanaerobaculia bacterium]